MRLPETDLTLDPDVVEMCSECEPLDLRPLAIAPAVGHEAERHAERPQLLQRPDRTGERRDRGISQLEVTVADRGSEAGVVVAQRDECLRGDLHPGLAHPRPPLPMSIRVAPEHVSHALDLAEQQIGIEFGACLSGFATGHAPAFVPRARVVEDRVVEIE